MKKYILLAFVIIIMPFVNIYLGLLFGFGDKIPDVPAVELWFRGFGILVIELVLLTIPGLLPVVGDVYMSYLGGALGFPHKRNSGKL